MDWIRKLIRWLAKRKKAAAAAVKAAEKELADHLKEAEYWGKKAFKEGNPDIKKAYQKFEQDYLKKAAEAEQKLHDLKNLSARVGADADTFIAQLYALDRTLATADLLVAAIDEEADPEDIADDEETVTDAGTAPVGSSRGAEARLNDELR